MRAVGTPAPHIGHETRRWSLQRGAGWGHGRQLGPGDVLRGGWDHGDLRHAAGPGGGAVGQRLPCALLAFPHGTGPAPVAAFPATSVVLSEGCLPLSDDVPQEPKDIKEYDKHQRQA